MSKTETEVAKLVAASYETLKAERDRAVALLRRVDALAHKLTEAGVLDNLKGIHPDEVNAVWDDLAALLARIGGE